MPIAGRRLRKPRASNPNRSGRREIMVSEVLYDVRGKVVVITINRPERRNAISLAVREQLREAFLKFEADPELRVGILTGAGDKAFCAGMDLKEAAELKLKVTPPLSVLGQNLRIT